MKIILLTLLCCIAGIMCVRAQTYAITLDAPHADQPANKKSKEELLTNLKEGLQTKGFLYDTRTDTLAYDTTFNKGSEIATDYLLTVYFDVYENYEPELGFVRDTNKKITGAYYTTVALTKYRIVLTDLRTDEMVQFAAKQSQSYSEAEAPKRIEIPMDEIGKVFGPLGPDGLKFKSKAEYARAEQKLLAAYRARLEEYYLKHRLPVHSYVFGVLNKMKPNKPIPIKNPVVDNGKLKSFEIPKDPSLRLVKDMWLPVFTLDTLGDYIYPNFYKYWVVDEIGATTAKAESKFLIPSDNKEAGEALEAHKTVFCTTQSQPFSMSTAKEDPIIIDIQGQELHREIEVYTFLARSPRMKIINSLEAQLVERFHQRFKGGRFVDSGYGLTPLGAQVILSTSDADYQLLDAKSGTVLGSCPKNFGDKGIFDLFQKSLDLKIRIIKPIDQKKDVLKSALVYSPIGFYDQFYFDVMLVTPEQVNGKTLYREVEIGRGNIYTVGPYGYLFAEAKFNKGEKEIYSAYNGKQSILFVSHAFKFPFIGTWK